MDESAESFGIAIIRVWKTPTQLLIRVVTHEGLEMASETDATTYATESIDGAIDHLRTFLNEIVTSQ